MTVLSPRADDGDATKTPPNQEPQVPDKALWKDETPTDAGVSGEALHRTRTDDPFLTMEGSVSQPDANGRKERANTDETGDSDSDDGPLATPRTPPKRHQTAGALVAALLLVLAALTAPAAAHAVTHPYIGPTEAQSTAIALAAWPDSPCASGFDIQWRTIAADDGTPLDGRADGAIPQPDGTLKTVACEISLAPALASDPSRECDVKVHEAGHLDDQVHTPSGIMQKDGGWWPACHVTTPRQDVINLVFGVLPRARRLAWDVTCTPHTTRCKAVAHGATTRRFLVTPDKQTIMPAGAP